MNERDMGCDGRVKYGRRQYEVLWGGKIESGTSHTL
jgi:hypothetical protein